MSNTKTIARNTGWYGLENVISAVVTLIPSIAIARTLGPSKMSYIIYVSWIASVVSSLGALGIPATTQKYMAEFIGMGDRGTARHIYFRTMLLQAGMASLATAGILIWILRDANAEYKLATALIALSVWPSMLNAVSAQANVAAEEMSKNMPASVTSMVTFFVAIMATVVFKWGVVGVGASLLLMRTVDFLVRLVPALKWIGTWETTFVRPPGLRRRMLAFSWQSVTTMILVLIVWDRSEFFLLKHLCSDVRQVTFYSVAFSMAERLLISAAVFGSATGATIFAQYGRDKTRLPMIMASSFRYLALTSIPLHLICATLAAPALLLLYGNQYRGALLVATLAPLLCLPKAFLGPVQNLLQSIERQGYVIAATAVAGVVDIGVAWYLIPAHGAVGACIGSGAAQVTAIGGMWAIAIYHLKIRLPWAQIAKITFISVVAALTAHYVGTYLAPLLAIVLGGSAALIVLFGLFYFMRVLEPEDRARFNMLAGILPRQISRPIDKLLSLLIRPELAGVTPTNV